MFVLGETVVLLGQSFLLYMYFLFCYHFYFCRDGNKKHRALISNEILDLAI